MSHIVLLADPALVLEYLDFDRNKYSVITYISAAARISTLVRRILSAVEPIEVDLKTIDSTLFEINYPMIREAARRIEKKVGKIDAIAGLIEPSIVPAATLRRELDLPGLTDKIAIRFRDKVIMKKSLQGSTVPFPRFLDLETAHSDQIDELLQSSKNGVVLKPKNQAAARDIFITTDGAALKTAIDRIDTSQFELEEYVNGEIFHVDGVVVNGKIIFLSALKYINAPVRWATADEPIGAIMDLDEKLCEKVGNFSDQVINQLGYRNGVFHLEAFYRNEDFVFLEIAARPGGAGIVALNKHCFGVDLIKCSYDLDVGNPVSLESRGILDKLDFCAGWLIMPPPTKNPFEVKGVAINLPNTDGSIFFSKIANIGDRFHIRPSSYSTPGEFLFKAKSAQAITDSISRVTTSFRIQHKEIPQY